jgi:hypothetical protein
MTLSAQPTQGIEHARVTLESCPSSDHHDVDVFGTRTQRMEYPMVNPPIRSQWDRDQIRPERVNERLVARFAALDENRTG